MALGLMLLLPLLTPTRAQAVNTSDGDAALYSLIENQRREARVCNGALMPPAQALVPSMDLSDLLEAGLASDTSPAVFAEANGLKDMRYQIIRVPGKTPRKAFERLLSRQCADIMEPSYRYVGIARSGGEWALLLSASEPEGDSRLARAQAGEPILLAANSGSSLPVIPKVPERSKRAPRRPASPAPAEMTAAPVAPAAPAPAPAPKMMAAPAPIPAAPVPAPAPAAPAPAKMAVSEPASEPLTEPLAPDAPKAPVAAMPKAAPAPLPFYEDETAMRAQAKSEPRHRGRRYDPNLVKDPSAATPYVTKEILVENGQMIVDGVPAPGARPAPPSAVEGGAPAPVAVGVPVPRYSTQPLVVSSPGETAAESAAALSVRSPYPGAVSSSVSSHDTQIYTDVPPARTAYSSASELPRDRMTLTPSLPAERISAPLAMELPLHRVMPLRPRR
jgi:hypothetical protein